MVLVGTLLAVVGADAYPNCALTAGYVGQAAGLTVNSCEECQAACVQTYSSGTFYWSEYQFDGRYVESCSTPCSQTCPLGYYGPTCVPCTCVHGVCSGDYYGNGTCLSCNAEWVNVPDCNACAPGYYGATCSACGACANSTVCSDGLDGTGVCDAGCAPGSFGLNCAPCPACVQGACNDGADGNGTCSCAHSWTGTLCTACLPGFFGSSCTDCPACSNSTTCDDTLVGTGACVGALSRGLVVGGLFATPSRYLGNWNATDWSSLRLNSNSPVYALATYQGTLVAAGAYTAPCGRIAQLNGAAWACLGGSTTVDNTVYALTAYQGSLVAGGAFTTPSAHIAAWNGTAWSSLGSGATGNVRALIVYNGVLIASGAFSSPFSRIAAWNGTAWSALASGATGTVYALSVYNGLLIAGGAFTSPSSHIAAWNGTTWCALGSGVTPGAVLALVVYDGLLIVGGTFTSPFSRLASWNGATWSDLGGGMDGSVIALTAYNGLLVAGGLFTNPFPYIASLGGSSWSSLGDGVSGGSVSALMPFCAVGSGYYGPACSPCATPLQAHASCDDGSGGDGALTCTDGWTGMLCDVCPSVPAYEGRMTGFSIPADAVSSAQACLVVDGAALQNGWVVTYAGGQTACCAKKGRFDAALCTHGCNHDKLDATNLFSLGVACFLDCYGVLVDACLSGPLVTSISATLAGTTVALNGDWAANQSTRRTYAVLTSGNTTLGAYGLAPSTVAAVADIVTLYCTGLGHVDAAGPLPVCAINCGNSVPSAFAFVGDTPTQGASCYYNCFTQ